MINRDLWMMRMSVVVIAALGFIGNGFAETSREQTKNTTDQQTKNSAVTSNADKPTTPPSPKSPPITEAQLKKVLNDLVQTGNDLPLIQRLAIPLGLSKNGEIVRMRQLAIADDNTVQYGFALLKDGRGYVLDKGLHNGNHVIFHLDATLTIVTALADSSAREISILSPADAEARLREVLATWAEYADTL